MKYDYYYYAANMVDGDEYYIGAKSWQHANERLQQIASNITNWWISATLIPVDRIPKETEIPILD